MLPVSAEVAFRDLTIFFCLQLPKGLLADGRFPAGSIGQALSEVWFWGHQLGFTYFYNFWLLLCRTSVISTAPACSWVKIILRILPRSSMYQMYQFGIEGSAGWLRIHSQGSRRGLHVLGILGGCCHWTKAYGGLVVVGHAHVSCRVLNGPSVSTGAAATYRLTPEGWKQPWSINVFRIL